jgi:uncharacterized protein YlxW (UPF0749 family)
MMHTQIQSKIEFWQYSMVAPLWLEEEEEEDESNEIEKEKKRQQEKEEELKRSRVRLHKSQADEVGIEQRPTSQ